MGDGVVQLPQENSKYSTSRLVAAGLSWVTRSGGSLGDKRCYCDTQDSVPEAGRVSFAGFSAYLLAYRFAARAEGADRHPVPYIHPYIYIYICIYIYINITIHGVNFLMREHVANTWEAAACRWNDKILRLVTQLRSAI